MKPQDLKGFDWFPLFGDRTQAGKLLWGINNEIFKDPVPLTGGFEYGILDPWAMWGEGSSKVSGRINKAEEIRKRGKEPLNMFAPQTHEASRFNDMTTAIMHHDIQALNLPKKTIKEFDDQVKKYDDRWLGLNHPEAEKQLHDLGKMRIAFNKAAGLKKFQDHGFPAISDAIFAVTHPDLLNYRDAPSGWSGRANFIPYPERRASTHGSYGEDI